MNKDNLIKTSKIIAICLVGGGMIATTGVIAHQLIVSNDLSFKIVKVENLGESEPNEDTNVCTTYLRITLNKAFSWGEINIDDSNEHIWSEWESRANSANELVYVNGNKVGIALTGGYVIGNDNYGYELDGPIITKILLRHDNGGFGVCEIDWGLDLVYWGAHDIYPDNISAEHVKDIKCTVNPLK